MALDGVWHFPRPVRFGAGRIDDLGAACRELGMTRPLIVSDPGIVATGMIDEAIASLARQGLPTTVFACLTANPTDTAVAAGAAVLREGRHDGVIPWGGGSALDAGKTIALMAHAAEPMWAYEWRPDFTPSTAPVPAPPIITVPTTAGTGSEMEGGAVITDTVDRVKRIVAHPAMAPRLVIADPALSVGLPANLTAWTGMDALSHCLEALFAPEFDPFSDGIAMLGTRLVKEWLPRAVADGRNVDARAHMLVAASMGAVAFRKGLGAMHGISHAVGALLDTQHGLTNAVVMPYVLAAHGPSIDEKATRLARFLDLADPSLPAFLAWVQAFRRSLGIPATLAALGVADSHVDALVPRVMADGNMLTNPVPLDAKAVRHLLGAAIHGEAAVLT
jgi:alcohol dehydrogenase class IV